MEGVLTLLLPLLIMASWLVVTVTSAIGTLGRLRDEQKAHRVRDMSLNALLESDEWGKIGGTRRVRCEGAKMTARVALCKVPSLRSNMGNNPFVLLLGEEPAVRCLEEASGGDESTRVTPSGEALSDGSSIAPRTCAKVSSGRLEGMNVAASTAFVTGFVAKSTHVVVDGFAAINNLIVLGDIVVVSGGDLRVGSLVGAGPSSVMLASATGRVSIGSLSGESLSVRVLSHYEAELPTFIGTHGGVALEGVILPTANWLPLGFRVVSGDLKEEEL